MSKSQLKKAKLVGIFLLSALMLWLYWCMDNSVELSEFLKKTDRRGAPSGLAFYAIIGLTKYTLLIAGISTPIILTALLLKKSGQRRPY